MGVTLMELGSRASWSPEGASICNSERARGWLEEQRSRWQKVAEEKKKILEEQHAVIGALESGKEWSATERARWQEVAEERNRLLEEQRQWIGEPVDLPGFVGREAFAGIRVLDVDAYWLDLGRLQDLEEGDALLRVHRERFLPE